MASPTQSCHETIAAPVLLLPCGESEKEEEEEEEEEEVVVVVVKWWLWVIKKVEEVEKAKEGDNH